MIAPRMPDEPSDPTPPPTPEAPSAAEAPERVALQRVVELENFRGPLDLLLHLVREQEMEITEVDLSGVCDQYLLALDVMRELDIDVAGEFLVIASTLILIKSRAILPREEVDLAEEIDPADELIGQLIEYRRFKTLSLELGRRAEQRGQRFGRGGKELPPDEERELAEISLWDLVGSFARLVEELGLERHFDALSGQRPLREYVRDVLGRLAASPSCSFRELVLDTAGKEGVFGVFLAVLELAKSSQIEVLQAGPGEEIRIGLREDRNESLLSDFLREDPVEAHRQHHDAGGDAEA